MAVTTMPTMPGLPDDRLSVEKPIEDSPKSVAPEMRKLLLTEPFPILNPTLESTQLQTHMDRPSVAGCLGIGVCAVFAVGSVSALRPEWQDVAAVTLLTLIGIRIVFTLVQVVIFKLRHHRRMMFPKLSRTLNPSQQDNTELEEVLLRFRKNKIRIRQRSALGEPRRQLHPLR